MRYITDRKRAMGKGAAHRGTEHHWYMTISAVGLAFLVPSVVYLFGSALGQDHLAVRAIFARPLPAILTGLTLFIAVRHFIHGATTMIEDYWRGTRRKALIIFVTALGYLTLATGFYALAKIAL